MITKISIIIPTLNEEKTIGFVVDTFKKHELKPQVLVIDNNSSDNTSNMAKSAGADVIHCPQKGYGYAIKAGLQQATSDWIFKLDGDITNPSGSWLNLLLERQQSTNADLVKGFWINENDPMPVTTLVARPAIKKMFPSLSSIRLPLSGLYLFNKNAIDWSRCSGNYGFSLEIMIRMSLAGKQISQQDLGKVYDCLKPVENYENMAFELLEAMMNIYEEKGPQQRLLLFMAHPDDAEIWCGGTLAKHLTNGGQAKLVILTGNSVRAQEAIRITKVFPNLQIELLQEKEFDLEAKENTINSLETIIKEFAPQILISHSMHDQHPDHRKCYNILNQVLLTIKRSSLPHRILCCNSYFERMSDQGFRPDMYVDIGEQADLKYSLIDNHSSQDTKYWRKMAHSIDQLNGLRSGVEYAEAFQTADLYATPAASKGVFNY